MLPNRIATALDEALTAFAVVQDEQRRAFETGAIGDLAVWRERRERAFGSLQYCLGRLTTEQAGQLDDHGFAELRQRIMALLDGEKTLEESAGRQRQVIQERLSSMRKGKRALSGYGPGYGNAGAARFLSSRT